MIQSKLRGFKNASVLVFLVAAFCQTAIAQDFPGLKDGVVLVIRHAEKPSDGKTLAPEGVERAKAYVPYFQDFQLDGKPLKLDALYAARDSKNSMRPRLTMEPLSQGLNLPLDSTFKDKDPEALAKELEATPQGTNILICWHHGKIPDLLHALGADPNALLPDGKWPEDVFWWVIELRYDHQGHLIPGECKKINEGLRPGDAAR